MKVKIILLCTLLIVCSEAFAQGTQNDTLYFCRSYENGTELGLSDLFAMGSGVEMITVMVKTNGPIKELHVAVKVEKVFADSMQVIATQKFDVERNWDYIFFADIKFPSEGLYHVSLLRENGEEIVSNFVTMVLRNK